MKKNFYEWKDSRSYLRMRSSGNGGGDWTGCAAWFEKRWRTCGDNGTWRCDPFLPLPDCRYEPNFLCVVFSILFDQVYTQTALSQSTLWHPLTASFTSQTPGPLKTQLSSASPPSPPVKRSGSPKLDSPRPSLLPLPRTRFQS